MSRPPELAGVSAVIFDVDGVLLDARPSYHAVAEEAARRAVAKVLDEGRARAIPFDRALEIPAFKAAGGFNDDWEMSRAIALLLLLRARGSAPDLAAFLSAARCRALQGVLEAWGDPEALGLSPARTAPLFDDSIPRVCCALYAGDRCRSLFGFDAREACEDAPAEGLWRHELPLAPAALLAALAARFPLALYTGRNAGEAALALDRLGLAIRPERCWVADGRPRKPDPAGLIWLCEQLAPGGRTLFLGDTRDDLDAALAAQARGTQLLYAHIQEPGDTERVLRALLDTRPSPGATMARTARSERKTKETKVVVVLDLDGTGRAKVATGIPFFDHMLETLARHGALDLELTCRGDLHIDQHHTVEDSGIALGDALDQALGERAGIARAGHFTFPLDEALARAVVDLSGRSWLDFHVQVDAGPRSAMDVSVLEGFFKAIADHGRLNLHLDLLRGRDFHHSAEAVFKAFARALRQAAALDPRVVGVPSTKGVL